MDGTCYIKTGSDSIIYRLGKYFFFLGLMGIMSKKQDWLRSELSITRENLENFSAQLGFMTQ